MKTICRLADFIVPNVSIYLFDDDTLITSRETSTVIGPLDNPNFIIMDVDPSNSVVYENVINPSGYTGWKYTYTPEDGWELNPNFKDPSVD